MDIENILEKLKPLDYHKETKCLTLIFEKGILFFLRDWEDGELMWHVFDNRESIDAGVDDESKILKALSNYLNDRIPDRKGIKN